MSFPLHGQFSLVACVIFCLTLSSAVNSAPSISAELAESQIVQAQSDVAQRTTIVADQISGTTDTETRATGGVELSKPGVLLKADQLTHTQSRDEADATGNVVLIGVREQISGPHVRLGLTDSIGFFEQPTYEISSSRPPDPLANPAFDQTIVAHGTAERLEFAGKGRYELTNATYSTCKSGANGEIDWFARAGRLNIDQDPAADAAGAEHRRDQQRLPGAGHQRAAPRAHANDRLNQQKRFRVHATVLLEYCARYGCDFFSALDEQARSAVG